MINVIDISMVLFVAYAFFFSTGVTENSLSGKKALAFQGDVYPGEKCYYGDNWSSSIAPWSRGRWICNSACRLSLHGRLPPCSWPYFETALNALAEDLEHRSVPCEAAPRFPFMSMIVEEEEGSERRLCEVALHTADFYSFVGRVRRIL
jgi:hypothetical protein